MLNKKAFHPLVATTLVMLVAVFSVLTYQDWFNSYSSGIFVGVEDNSNINKDYTMTLEDVVGDSLYINSGTDQVLSVFKIINSTGGEICGFENSDTSSLKGRWTFDEVVYDVGGNYTPDTSGNDYHGLLRDMNLSNSYGVAQLVSGKLNNGFRFNGHDALIDTSFYYTGLSEVTLSFWFNHSGGGDGLTGTFGRPIQSRPTTIRLTYSGTNLICSYNPSVNSNDWNNFIISYNTTHCFFHINNNTVEIVDALDDQTLAPDYLRIGWSNNPWKDYFNGTMDEFRIYNKSLSLSEVQALKDFYDVNIPLSIGVNKIPISSCNLTKGETYSVLGFTDNSKLEETFYYD